MKIKNMIKKVFPWSPKLYRRLVDGRKLKRVLNPIDVSRLCLEPVSRLFGFDRGTPIDRYYVEKFLSCNDVRIKGNILEIAESTYSRRFTTDKNAHFHVLTLDVPPVEDTIIKGDLTDVRNLPEDMIDCFICTSTLNFIYDVKAAIRGCYRLLAPGGYLLVTVSGLTQISQYDMVRWGDYWRFNELSIRKLMEEVFEQDKIEVVSYGNLAAVVAELQGLALEDLESLEILEKVDKDYPLTIGVVAQK